MKTNSTPDLVDRLVADWKREDPASAPDAMQVVGRILRLGRRYQEEVSLLLRPHRLSYSDFDVIATLRRSVHPYELTPTELQQSVLLTSGAMTACLRRLELASLILRKSDRHDGRRWAAKLTKKGQTQVEKLIDQRFALARASLANLSAKQIDTIVSLLRRLDSKPA